MFVYRIFSRTDNFTLSLKCTRIKFTKQRHTMCVHKTPEDDVINEKLSGRNLCLMWRQNTVLIEVNFCTYVISTKFKFNFTSDFVNCFIKNYCFLFVLFLLTSSRTQILQMKNEICPFP